jgi:glycosyltransferase involved in cell wall biosynthesis
VFNGENYIEAAIDSILNQTYTDFELILVDNASTDKTQQICQEYEAKDKRVSYYRNKINIGAVANYNRAFSYSSGEYFKWAAHDDVLAPEFLSKCIKVLDNDPSIVLCHTKTGRINEHGELLDIYTHKVKTDLPKPHERFGEFVLRRYEDNSWVFIFGLMRATLLRKTKLQGKFIGSDINLLAEISLLGRIYEVPEVLFFRRYHQEALSNKSATKKLSYDEIIVWWVGQYRFSFIWSRICLEYFKSVNRASLKLSERLLSYAQILKWFAKIGWIQIVDEMGTFYLTRSRLGIKLAPFVKQIRNNLTLGEIK